MGDKNKSIDDARPPTPMIAGPMIAAVLYARARGIPMHRITAATGLTPKELLRLDGHLPDQHMATVSRMLLEEFPERALGLEMAAAIPFSFLGLLFLSTRHCASLREVLQTFERYQGLLSSQVQVTLTLGRRECEIEMSHPLDKDDYGCTNDFGIAIAIRYFREVLGSHDALVKVMRAHAPVGRAECYTDFFGVEVVFNAGRNAAVFQTEALERPLAKPNRVAFDLARAHLDRLREHELARRIDPVLDRIIETIDANAQRGRFDVTALAQRLATTPRSLQRLVAAQGVTLRVLLNKARESRSLALLDDPRRSIGEIAEAVGYSSESSFRRAFHRWTGMSPKAARRQRAATTQSEQ